MKNQFKILVLLFLVHLTAAAQENKSAESGSILLDSTSANFISYNTKDLVLTSSFSPTFVYNLFEVNNSERVFLIGSDGAVFYNPKYFCKCKSCKKKKGLKKLKY